MKAKHAAVLSTEAIIRVAELTKTYRQGSQQVPVFSNLSLDIRAGEFVALMGSSGAGKSTLLQLLGCLDRPTSGQYWLDGEEISRLPEEGLASIRNKKIGFVFQTSYFVDYLDLIENVALPGFYAQSLSSEECHQRASSLLDQVGLSHRRTHVPGALSGGERQRAAIARALFNEPKLLLADEPTGNLDSSNADRVMDTLKSFNDSGITILLVTHDARIAQYADRTLEMVDGVLEERRHDA